MYYLVLVKVVHTSGDLLGPLHKLLGRNLLALTQQVEQGSIGTVFHDNTEDGCLGAHPAELYDVWVVELPQVLNVDLVLFLHLLDRDSFPFVLANKNCSLGSRAEPFQVRNVLKRNLPVI